MLLENLISHTREILPLFDSRFTDNLAINTITKSGDTVSVNAPGHGLNLGQNIVISGVKTVVNITNITTNNGIATATCATDHDLSFGFSNYVEIQSPEAAYTGSFKILSVPSILTFTFEVASNPSDNTGKLKTYQNIGFNGSQTVSKIVNVDNFEYELKNDNLNTGDGANMLVMVKPRISGAIDLDRIVATYTKFQPNKLYAFFVFENTTTSNDNNVDNDSKNERTKLDDFKLRLINNLILYVVVPTQKETSGRLSIDICQELVKPIYKTLAGLITPSVFSPEQQTILMPSGHSIAAYNTSYLIYQYEFQNTEFMLSQGEKDISNGITPEISNGITPEILANEFMSNTGDTLPNIETRAFRAFDKWGIKNDFNEIVKNDLINIE